MLLKTNLAFAFLANTTPIELASDLPDCLKGNLEVKLGALSVDEFFESIVKVTDRENNYYYPGTHLVTRGNSTTRENVPCRENFVSSNVSETGEIICLRVKAYEYYYPGTHLVRYGNSTVRRDKGCAEGFAFSNSYSGGNVCLNLEKYDSYYPGSGLVTQGNSTFRRRRACTEGYHYSGDQCHRSN